jgi:hypothetical protein
MERTLPPKRNVRINLTSADTDRIMQIAHDRACTTIRLRGLMVKAPPLDLLDA